MPVEPACVLQPLRRLLLGDRSGGQGGRCGVEGPGDLFREPLDRLPGVPGLHGGREQDDDQHTHDRPDEGLENAPCAHGLAPADQPTPSTSIALIGTSTRFGPRRSTWPTMMDAATRAPRLHQVRPTSDTNSTASATPATTLSTRSIPAASQGA
jgi:hypothetical protein